MITVLDKRCLMKKKGMTPREEEIMELLWKENKALTSVDILQKLDPAEWNNASVFRTIKTLLSGKYVKVCGMEQYNKQYARQFIPAITREDYAVELLSDRGLNEKSIMKIALAMVRKEKGSKKDREELIEELENMIQKVREEK